MIDHKSSCSYKAAAGDAATGTPVPITGRIVHRLSVLKEALRICDPCRTYAATPRHC